MAEIEQESGEELVLEEAPTLADFLENPLRYRPREEFLTTLLIDVIILFINI
jgi:hypothetical protein